jgi:hypothetical protein
MVPNQSRDLPGNSLVVFTKKKRGSSGSSNHWRLEESRIFFARGYLAVIGGGTPPIRRSRYKERPAQFESLQQKGFQRSPGGGGPGVERSLAM